ncbi:MAG: internal scaffolding protein [Microvirus sp.]|nr:MAG: internal scaffolding protein [Microvirus sp.]
MVPKVRNWLNIDKLAWSDENASPVANDSRTVQSMAEEADINNIVKAFGVTGQLPVSARIPSYGDFEGVDDYRTAIEAIREAENSFAQMPSGLRNQLNNDPQKFVEWCADERNLPEMRKLGLAIPQQNVVAPPAQVEPATT